MATVLLGSTP